MADLLPAEIDRFTGRWGFLSNFSAATVVLDGQSYRTVEHAFQAAKVLPDQLVFWQPLARKDGLFPWRAVIQEASTPSAAKRLGRRVPLRPGWEAMKIAVMQDLLCQKFSPGRQHLEWLLATHPATLIEGNTWNDTFWGVCQGKGENHLGRLLMTVREVRRQERDSITVQLDPHP
jgi:hypothetical protein